MIRHAARLPTDGLVMLWDPANARGFEENLLPYSEYFASGSITATDVIAPDGTPTASVLTDSNNASFVSTAFAITVPNDSSTYMFSVYVKKTYGATSARLGANLEYLDGTTQLIGRMRLNTDTGVVAITTQQGNIIASTQDVGTYWRLYGCITNNATGNVTLKATVFPAVGPYDGADSNTAVSSATIWGTQITKGPELKPYTKTTGTAKSAKLLDLAGNGYHGLFMGGADLGAGVVGLQASTSSYVNLDSLPLADVNSTIIAAARYTGGANGRTISAGNNWLMGHHSGTVDNLHAGAWVKNPTLPADTLWRIYTATNKVKEDIYDFQVNNVQQTGLTVNGGNKGPNSWQIGRYQDTQYSNAELGFLVCYDRVLNPDERSSVFNAFRGRYRI